MLERLPPKVWSAAVALASQCRLTPHLKKGGCAARLLNESLRCWRAAKAIIGQFLRELRPDLSAEAIEHNAGAMLARLAQHDPPLMIEFCPLDDA